MAKTCPKCGAVMERGVVAAAGLTAAQLVLDIDTATSSNPVKAFKQGLAGEPENRRYQIVGFRCAGCGLVELYSDEPVA